MEVIVILIAASLGLAGLFLGVFLWAGRSGQFDDTTTPALRILTDDPPAVASPISFPTLKQAETPSPRTNSITS